MRSSLILTREHFEIDFSRVTSFNNVMSCIITTILTTTTTTTTTTSQIGIGIQM